MPPKNRSPDDVHNIWNVEIGKPYRGSLVEKIDIETTNLDDDKVKVRRLIHLDDGIIIIEDTIHDYGDVFVDGKLLPYNEIKFPSMDPADFAAPAKYPPKDDEDEKRKKRELLRQKAKDMLKPNGHPDTNNNDNGNNRLDINVKTHEGTLIPVVVKPDDTVKDLKEKIEDACDVPVHDQILSRKGKPLDDPKSTMEDNGIQDGDTLDLNPSTNSNTTKQKRPGTTSADNLIPAGTDRKRILSPTSAWVYPTKTSAPKKGEINNLQGIWSTPPTKDAGADPVEVNIHPKNKEPKSDGKADIHGAYGYTNGAKPDGDGVVDPTNVVFYPPGTNPKDYSPDFEHIGWWSAPESSSETHVSWKFVGDDILNVKRHTVNVMGHEMTFVTEWTE